MPHAFVLADPNTTPPPLAWVVFNHVCNELFAPPAAWSQQDHQEIIQRLQQASPQEILAIAEELTEGWAIQNAPIINALDMLVPYMPADMWHQATTCVPDLLTQPQAQARHQKQLLIQALGADHPEAAAKKM